TISGGALLARPVRSAVARHAGGIGTVAQGVKHKTAAIPTPVGWTCPASVDGRWLGRGGLARLPPFILSRAQVGKGGVAARRRPSYGGHHGGKARTVNAGRLSIRANRTFSPRSRFRIQPTNAA